jgi:endogenous inhibitor of DNA gyrase (YacG/DUF329 family)
MTQPSPPPPKKRTVRCPCCGGPSLYAPENPWRPFCSERCKTQDLSAWASERYAVDASQQPRDDDEPDRPPQRDSQ